MADAEQLPYINHLRRHTDDELRTLSLSLKQLTAQPGWGSLVDLIDEAHGNAVSRLLLESAGVDGKVRPHEDLTRLLGFLSGLSQFRVAAEAVQTAYERRARQNDPEGAP